MGSGSESTEAAGETIVVAMASEGKADGSLGEGGSSHGNDVMVEVFGSDVFVDGICDKEGGEGDNSGDDAERGGCAEEGEVVSLDGRNHEVKDSDSRGGIEMLVDASKFETESVEVCSGTVESSEGEKGIVVAVTEENIVVIREEKLEGGDGDDGNVDQSNQEVGDSNEEAHDGKTQDVIIEEVKVVDREEVYEGGCVDVVDRYSELKGGDLSMEEIEVPHNDVKSSKMSGNGGSLETLAPAGDKDVNAMECEQDIGEGVSTEVSEEGEKVIVKDDALDGSKIEKASHVEKGIMNPEISTAAISCPVVVEKSGLQVPVVNDNAAIVIRDEVSNSKNAASGCDGLEEFISNTEVTESLVATTDQTDKDYGPNTNSTSFDEITPLGVEEEAAAMHIEAFDEKANPSVDKEHENVERVGGSIENESIISKDSGSFHPTQISNGTEVAEMEEKVIAKEHFEEALTNVPAQVNANDREQLEVRQVVTDPKNVSLPETPGIEVEDQVVKADIDVGSIEAHGHVNSAASLSNFSKVVEGEVATSNSKEVHLVTDLDSPFGNNQNLMVETMGEGDNENSKVEEKGELDNKEILNSNNENPDAAEKVQQLNIEDSAENSVPCDLVLVESSEAQNLEIEEQVTAAEQLGLCGRQELTVEENSVTCDVVGEIGGKHNDVCEHSSRSLDDDLVLDPIVEVPDSANLNGTLPCTANNENLKADKGRESADIRTRASDGGDTAPMNRADVLEINVVTEQQFSRSLDDVVPDPSVEVPESANLNGTLPCINNDENLKAEKGCENAEIDTSATDGGETAPMDTEEVLEMNAVSEQQLKIDYSLDKSKAYDHLEVQPDVEQDKVVEKQITGENDLQGKREGENEDQITNAVDYNIVEEKSVKQAALGSHAQMDRVRYQLEPEEEGSLSVSDLVWGKVRSHPWWPGQIFNPSDASEQAMKYHKKDCFLVAFFGDHTFAWNEASSLKPFMDHFSQIEKHSNSDAFHSAVDSALEEVARRVELGLACSCIPKDAYEKIEFQVVENAGIQTKSSRRYGVDDSSGPNSFEPENLVEYVKALAQFPSDGADRLDLVIAKAQLLAFYRSKGYLHLPEFQLSGDIENNVYDDVHIGEDEAPVWKVEQETRITQKVSSHKRKHNLRDTMYARKKERNLSELQDGIMEYLDGENESDFLTDDSAMKGGINSSPNAKISQAMPSPKPSFKIGDCIRRVASQMTGSPSILKSNNEKLQNSEATYSSLNDLLSQLHLAAQDPKEGHGFMNIIVNFFSDFRNSVVSRHYNAKEKVNDRRKRSSRISETPETFEFEDMNDSYWMDMIVQNGGEDPNNTDGGLHLALVEEEKPRATTRRTYSRKRYRGKNIEPILEETVSNAEEQKRAISPAELLLTFPDSESIPSEIKLIKMFRRFGPLKESETEIDRFTNRARVVFKRGSDAEVALSSAGTFNVFGSIRVNYQISYTPSQLTYSPSVLFSSSLIDTPDGQDVSIDISTL